MKWETKSVIGEPFTIPGGPTIWTVSNGETEENTMSKTIAKVGWSGEIEKYQNEKSKKFYIRQPAKEGFTTSTASVDYRGTQTEQLDRIEKKLDELIALQGARSPIEKAVLKGKKDIDNSEFTEADIPIEDSVEEGEPF